VKKESINKLFSSAKTYKEKFVGMNFVFIYRYDNGILNFKEVKFPAYAFKHLTGIQADMTSNDFLDACVNQRLPSSVTEKKNDIAEVKLSVLPTLLNTSSYRYIGEFMPSGVFIETEALAGNKVACLGIDREDDAKLYYPKTVLKDDIRKRVYKPSKIVAILSKRIEDDSYSITNYLSKDLTLEQIYEVLNNEV